MRQGEARGGHLPDPQKCIIQGDNYTLGSRALPRAPRVKDIFCNVIIFQEARHLQLNTWNVASVLKQGNFSISSFFLLLFFFKCSNCVYKKTKQRSQGQDRYFLFCSDWYLSDFSIQSDPDINLHNSTEWNPTKEQTHTMTFMLLTLLGLCAWWVTEIWCVWLYRNIGLASSKEITEELNLLWFVALVSTLCSSVSIWKQLRASNWKRSSAGSINWSADPVSLLPEREARSSPVGC